MKNFHRSGRVLLLYNRCGCREIKPKEIIEIHGEIESQRNLIAESYENPPHSFLPFQRMMSIFNRR